MRDNLFQRFWKEHTAITHAVAAAFASLVVAYAAVPQFHAFVDVMYLTLSPQTGKAVVAGIALYSWYHKSQEKGA